MPETTDPWAPFNEDEEAVSELQPAETVASPYDAKTLGWRQEQFAKVGYDEDWANFLAHSRIDLHTVQDWAEIGTDLAVIVFRSNLRAALVSLGADEMALRRAGL